MESGGGEPVATTAPSKSRPVEDSSSSSFFEDSDIPLVDADPTLVISDDAASSVASGGPPGDMMNTSGASSGGGGCYLNEDAKASKLWRRGILGDDCESMDSIPSMLSDHLTLGCEGGSSSTAGGSKVAGSCSISDQMHRHLSLDPDFSPDEVEEKARLIAQVNENNNDKRTVQFLSTIRSFSNIVIDKALYKQYMIST